MNKILLILLLATGLSAAAQTPSDSTLSGSQAFPIDMGFIKTDSGVIMQHYTRVSCKAHAVSRAFDAYKGDAQREHSIKRRPDEAPFLTVHGNVAYDFFYQSNVDTPFNQRDLQQHTERVYLDVLVKNKYPLHVGFTARQSNSPWFHNFSDINFQFDRYAYMQHLRQDLLNQSAARLLHRPDLDSLTDSISLSSARYASLKGWLENPFNLQKIIEERERKFNQHLHAPGTPGLSALPKDFMQQQPYPRSELKLPDTTLDKSKMDSLADKYAQLYETKKRELDSLHQQLQRLRRQADSIRQAAQASLAAVKQKIYNASDQKQLQQVADDNGDKLSQGKLDKHLAAVKTFSIGKSMLNYTELTAQHITVTGINVEYNPSYYIAFAAGKIDYNFRDFYSATAFATSNSGQYLLLGRVGWGDKDKKALILTLFEGRKSLTQYSLSDTAGGYVNVLGYSLEGIYRLDKNTLVSAEFAKSTEPIVGEQRSAVAKQTNVLLDYSDKTNMGVNLKAATAIPSSGTRISGFYRSSGENFQSFSLFSYNTHQVAWQARIDQDIYKKQVVLTGMLRQNDFTNPLVDQSFKTSTIFKSILLGVRFPRYPYVSLGYYPGTQLYAVNNEKLTENAYYILNGSVTYSYLYKNIRMNSSVVYNRYFTQATDSGMVLYRGITYYASQSAFFNKLQLQGTYAYNDQPGLVYYTVEASADYALKRWLKIGGGIKYNQVAAGAAYAGSRGEVSADFNKAGGFRFQYDKSYIPSASLRLYPIVTGRISWYKYF